MFQKGDRVVLIGPSGNDALQVGNTGTVCCNEREYHSNHVRVRWDLQYRDLRHFHSCGDNCEQGYGWNVLEEYLDYEVVTSHDFDVLSDDLFSLIGGLA